DALYAGILEYDGDLHIPSRYLVSPPTITQTLTEVLCKHGIREYALSETQKYGHVTYFWNGNRGAKFDEALETWEEIPSDNISFDEKPEMKCREITQKMIAAMQSGCYDFLRCNFPNGDMVGHTGNFSAVIASMQALDACIGTLAKQAESLGYTLLLTADHGNADKMLDVDKKGVKSVRTAHSLNPVPFIVCGGTSLKSGSFGLANVAATIAQLLDVPAPDCWQESMLT
ncbi:MAG: alkaline phosphatase family protein, partial [Oscillospiraceae bacterium]|nr:alkaline phosphatase family protein [Oscillospiraceae bacterium]